MKFEAYQKYHKRTLPVTKIEWKDGEIVSVTLDYGRNNAPRFITYTDAYPSDFVLHNEEGSVLELKAI